MDGSNEAQLVSDEIGDAGREFLNLHELVHRARGNLDQNAWDYIVGGTETETCLLYTSRCV